MCKKWEKNAKFIFRTWGWFINFEHYSIYRIKKIDISTIPDDFKPVFTFNQLPTYEFQYNRINYFFLDNVKLPNADYPFPDYRDYRPDIEEEVISILEQDPCPYCGSVLLKGMEEFFLLL